MHPDSYHLLISTVFISDSFEKIIKIHYRNSTMISPVLFNYLLILFPDLVSVHVLGSQVTMVKTVLDADCNFRHSLDTFE